MSGPRVGKCPGCGRDVRVSADGKLWPHGPLASGRPPTDTILRWGDCPWSYKPAPETRPAQLELGRGEP